LDEKKVKILFVGLDKAGKTSFLLSLENKYSQLYSLKPTKGYERRSFETLGFDISLFDFGGQERYREEFLNNERNYHGVDLLFYIFDVQDRHRFAENAEFFEKIMKILQEKNENPEILVCFHKSDPDLLQDQDSFIYQNLQIAEKLVKKHFTGKPTKFFRTSIFDYSSLVRAFSAGLVKIIKNSTAIMETIFRDFIEKTNSNGVSLLDQDALTIYGASDQDPTTSDIIETIGPNIVQTTEKLITYQIEKPNTIVIRMKGRCFIDVIELDNKKRFYLIIYSRNTENYQKINELLPNFTLTIKNTLKNLMSS